MKVKKRSWQSLLFMVVTILALMMPQTVFATGGTDGTELQVAEPASLEIQLGAEWAGVEFELKTDAGLYEFQRCSSGSGASPCHNRRVFRKQR